MALAEPNVSVLLSDIHLSLTPKPATVAALAKLLAEHRGARFVFVGDWFEFSMLDTSDAASALERLSDVNREVLGLLKTHTDQGGQVEWVAGNHDAAVALLGERVGQIWGFPVSVYPWFRHLNGAHIEHGHFYDRDNAPIHPAHEWSPDDEPLGTALMRRFIARHELLDFAHAHQTTPLAGIKRAHDLLGGRVPGLIFAYLKLASQLCLAAPRLGRVAAELTLDPGLWASSGVPEEDLVKYVLALAEHRAQPTHAKPGATFMRLYLDQVSAAVFCGVGALSLATGGVVTGLAGLGMGGSYLLLSRSPRGTSRYPGPEAALRDAGLSLAQTLGVSSVVMGHSHVPERSGAYVNLGSFGYPREGKRGYALLQANGECVSHYQP